MSAIARARAPTINPVLAVLVVAILLAGFGLGFVTVAPNRIVSGQPIALWNAVAPRLLAALVATFALLALAMVLPAARYVNWVMVAAGAVLLLLALLAAGSAASLAVHGAPAARVSLGAGFWIIASAAALAASDGLNRLGAHAGLRVAFALCVALVIAGIAFAGWLDDLSLAREFANRRDSFAAELGRHVVLVLAALLPAVVIGAALGVAALRGPADAIFSALGIVQTIPSIALFALLIGPLSGLSEAFPLLRELGLRGIGAAPAVIALALYGLLPVARSFHAGFAGVPAAALDAARGMGMGRWQVLRDVRLPLALPVLLAGLRIVTIQLIGLAVVAALIGAGGLGTFVFQGLGQTATDLVLLGALSAIGLALLVDGLLRSLADMIAGTAR